RRGEHREPLVQVRNAPLPGQPFPGPCHLPYGPSAEMANGSTTAQEFEYCHIPGTNDPAQRIKVEVKKQLHLRRPENAVYCSCRCNGPDPNARYCKCPTGFQCVE